MSYINCSHQNVIVANHSDHGNLNSVYHKTLYVNMPFISRISRAKQNREIKGSEYQLQANIERTYYSISNCMVLIRQN